jgi:zona occludens toxin (predicted ATPase)
MVSIAVAGDAAFYRVTQERTVVVERCLEALHNIGCSVPDFSSFKIKQLEMGESIVVQAVERLCRAHQDVV